jgi:hypothetical protein
MAIGARQAQSPGPERGSPRGPCDGDVVRQPPLRTQDIPPQHSRHPERDHRQQDRLSSPNTVRQRSPPETSLDTYRRHQPDRIREPAERRVVQRQQKIVVCGEEPEPEVAHRDRTL